MSVSVPSNVSLPLPDLSSPPYDAYDAIGSQWPGLVIFIILLVPTLLFNATTIFFILSSKQLRCKINPILVVYLALEDGFLTLFCLLSCVSNLASDKIYLNSVGCEMQAMYIVFFMLSTGYTLCCISYHNERRVRNKKGLSWNNALYIHIVLWCWSALITYFSTDGPNTSARVMPSGIYCLVSLEQLTSGLLFFIPGITTIGAFLIHRYASLYLYIRKKVWKMVVPASYKAVDSTNGGSGNGVHLSRGRGSMGNGNTNGSRKSGDAEGAEDHTDDFQYGSETSETTKTDSRKGQNGYTSQPQLQNDRERERERENQIIISPPIVSYHSKKLENDSNANSASDGEGELPGTPVMSASTPSFLGLGLNSHGHSGQGRRIKQASSHTRTVDGEAKEDNGNGNGNGHHQSIGHGVDGRYTVDSPTAFTVLTETPTSGKTSFFPNGSNGITPSPVDENVIDKDEYKDTAMIMAVPSLISLPNSVDANGLPQSNPPTSSLYDSHHQRRTSTPIGYHLFNLPDSPTPPLTGPLLTTLPQTSSTLALNAPSVNHSHSHSQHITPAPAAAHPFPKSSAETSYQHRVKAARKMFFFVLSFFICASPVLILSLYELGGTNAPGETHIMAGFFIHFNSLLNPLLYFWTNPQALRMVPLLQKYWFKENENAKEAETSVDVTGNGTGTGTWNGTMNGTNNGNSKVEGRKDKDHVDSTNTVVNSRKGSQLREKEADGMTLRQMNHQQTDSNNNSHNHYHQSMDRPDSRIANRDEMEMGNLTNTNFNTNTNSNIDNNVNTIININSQSNVGQ